MDEKKIAAAPRDEREDFCAPTREQLQADSLRHMLQPTAAQPMPTHEFTQMAAEDFHEPTFEDVPAMSREDLEAHYRMAMLNWRTAMQQRDKTGEFAEPKPPSVPEADDWIMCIHGVMRGTECDRCDRGREAWADVPDASAWVQEQRAPAPAVVEAVAGELEREAATCPSPTLAAWLRALAAQLRGGGK